MQRDATSGAGPHDVTMPQLGMAQDAGRIVAWLKAAGDPVAKGDALFEVETDKATMEVEAQASGFLTGITAAEGEDVPVGAIIARISASAEDDSPAPDLPQDKADALPEGRAVTMPQLGMAQDSGVLVSWTKALGDKIAADDILFEVETDKSTMEVPAGVDGYLAATLADAGEDVPVGATLAIISDSKPDAPVARGVKAAPATAKAPAPTPPAKAKEEPAPKPQPMQSPTGRILASPKARRLALERGLDLNDLVKAGHPQPFHMRDLDVLANLPAKTAAPAAALAATATIRLTAEIATDGFTAFAQWAAANHGLSDRDAILAGIVGASLAQPGTIAIERHGQTRGFAIPADRALSAVTISDDSPDLILRDLRDTALRAVTAGAEDTPVLTLMSGHMGLILTLECSADQMPAPAAIALLSAFAGRMEHPLRHLL